MKRIFVPTQTGSDWQHLLAQPILHWKKGKSAMTTAASWENAGDALPPEISKLLISSADPDLVGLTLLAALPEWETPLEGGQTTSHTDILALVQNERGLCVVAVEAKVDEDFGPLVKAKRAGQSDGQHSRLNFLQSVLGVNAPPPKGGGFELRLKAGLVRLWRTQVTLKSSSGSGGVWFLIYSAHTSSVTLPLLVTQ
jgi:hypothetical protein